jgi:hypothetical protein
MDTSSTAARSRPTLETSQDFIDAVSLCAELEGMCLPAGRTRLLPFIGMARNELTNNGASTPSHYRSMPIGSVDEGVQRLEQLLTTLIGQAEDLLYAVRLHEAREILREGSAP